MRCFGCRGGTTWYSRFWYVYSRSMGLWLSLAAVPETALATLRPKLPRRDLECRCSAAAAGMTGTVGEASGDEAPSDALVRSRFKGFGRFAGSSELYEPYCD